MIPNKMNQIQRGKKITVDGLENYEIMFVLCCRL